MPRFVLLFHDCPPDFPRPSHWDLMLESQGVLRTWALPRLPRPWEAAREQTARLTPHCAETSSELTIAATMLADHRIDFLEEEGPLSGGRGEVRRIDSGIFETRLETATDWTVVLSGEFVSGQITLQETSLILQSTS